MKPRSGETLTIVVRAGKLPGRAFAEYRGVDRAKLQLDAGPAAMIEDALKSATGEIVAELDLIDAKGGPRCASVRPPAIRWSLPR